jgi:hypothetical protein
LKLLKLVNDRELELFREIGQYIDALAFEETGAAILILFVYR